MGKSHSYQHDILPIEKDFASQISKAVKIKIWKCLVMNTKSFEALIVIVCMYHLAPLIISKLLSSHFVQIMNFKYLYISLGETKEII